MKNIHVLLVSFIVFGLAACTNPTNKVEGTDPAASPPQTQAPASTGTNYVLQKELSSIRWKGENKFTPKNHVGTLQFSEGSFRVADKHVTSGSFTADMSTITAPGDEYTDGTKKVGYLIDHLKSADFFDVAKFPTSTFTVTSVLPKTDDPNYTHEITGNLTIKGITKQITFPAKVELGLADLKASTVFTIDRSQWEVKYGSESFFPDLVKDKLIKNEIELTLNLVAKAS